MKIGWTVTYLLILEKYLQQESKRNELFKNSQCKKYWILLANVMQTEYASSEIPALLWRRNFMCPRTYIAGYKAYTLYMGNVVNVALKFISSSYTLDRHSFRMHFWAYFNINPTLNDTEWINYSAIYRIFL